MSRTEIWWFWDRLDAGDLYRYRPGQPHEWDIEEDPDPDQDPGPVHLGMDLCLPEGGIPYDEYAHWSAGLGADGEVVALPGPCGEKRWLVDMFAVSACGYAVRPFRAVAMNAIPPDACPECRQAFERLSSRGWRPYRDPWSYRYRY